MTDFRGLLAKFTGSGVEFLLVGGAAAIAHGSIRLTLAIDVVYRRTPENLRRLVKALASCEPYLRGVPPGLPFKWDEETLRRGLNFTLTTSLGDVDLLGEITGGGDFEALMPYTMELQPFGLKCRVLTLGKLIEVKRAVGRPKDLEAIAELEAIEEERGE